MGSRLGNVQRSSFLQNSRKSFVFYPLVHALIEDFGGVCGWPRRTVRVTRIRALITSSDCAMYLEFLSRKDGLCWDLRMKGYSILRVSPRNSCSRGPKKRDPQSNVVRTDIPPWGFLRDFNSPKALEVLSKVLEHKLPATLLDHVLLSVYFHN